jgi:hypothetical protein
MLRTGFVRIIFMFSKNDQKPLGFCRCEKSVVRGACCAQDLFAP